MTGRHLRHLRDATSADLDALVGLHTEVSIRSWTRATLSQELERDDRVWLVADVAGEVVAAGAAADLAGDAHVLSVTVAGEHRRRGHATAIVVALLDACRERFGDERATLEVRASNQAARALYRRCGFAEVGVRPGYYQDDREDAVVLWCDDVAAALDQLRSSPADVAAPPKQPEEDPA